MRDRGCLLGLSLMCLSAALVVGVLMFAPLATLAWVLQVGVLLGAVAMLLGMVARRDR
jgi:hypothetical protein